MKKDIHPTYYKDAVITCACGNVIHAGSTQKEIHVEICSACHPFFTGKSKLIDAALRVNKFQKRMEMKVEAAKLRKGKKQKKITRAHKKISKKATSEK